MTPVATRHERSLVAELLDLTPVDRNRWLTALPRRDLARLIPAVTDQLGSPYGLWQDDPHGFIGVVLGETLWSTQRTITSTVEACERTAVPSCHDSGKSHLAARLVAWWVAVHPPGTAQVVTTADRWRKVRAQLWPHIRGLHRRYGLPGECLQTEWHLGDHIVAYGFSPGDQDQEAFSSIHYPHVLVIVDEAGNLSPTLGRSLEAVMAGGHARILVIGNPPMDETGSPWFEERCLSPNWEPIQISAFDTPNFTGEPTGQCAVHPGMESHTIASHLVTPHWERLIADDEGVESPYYQARVLAQFPKAIANKCIPRTWVDDAIENDDPEHDTWVRLGVDVAAGGGDELAIVRAEGFEAWLVHATPGTATANTFDIAGIVLDQIEAAERRRRELGERRPVRVKIDSLGVGLGVYDTLRAWGGEGRHSAEIVGVRVSERCTSDRGQERFANQRAEMWWNGRELFQPGRGPDGSPGPPRVRLHAGVREAAQLAGPRYGHNSAGRRQIESKDSMRQRGVPSPDRAEAILLAWYEPGYGSAASMDTATGLRLPER